MSTFFTATKNARKEGYTHLVSGNGEKAPLSAVTKGMKAAPKLSVNGWEFALLLHVGQCLVYRSRKGIEGYYKLVKEVQP